MDRGHKRLDLRRDGYRELSNLLEATRLAELLLDLRSGAHVDEHSFDDRLVVRRARYHHGRLDSVNHSSVDSREIRLDLRQLSFRHQSRIQLGPPGHWRERTT